MLYRSLFAGLALFAAVSVVVLSIGAFVGVFSPSPTQRSAAALIVGLGSYVGVRVSRSAYPLVESSNRGRAGALSAARALAGWSVIDGLGIGGICFGLLAGSIREVVVLAGIAAGAMFLARPPQA